VSLNESIVEDAALTMPGAAITRPLPAGEEKREAILAADPADVVRQETLQIFCLASLNPCFITTTGVVMLHRINSLKHVALDTIEGG